MKYLLVVLLAAVLSSITTYFIVKPQQYVTDLNLKENVPINAMEVEKLVNGYRVNLGLNPLEHDPKLCEIAEDRLKDVPLDWSHAGFKEKYYLENTPNAFYKSLGENLAKDYQTSLEVLYAWSKSPTHKENIVNPKFTHSCIATDTNHVVHIFAGY